MRRVVLFLGSIDPNDLLGPAGYGAQGWLAPGRTLPYTIQFENDPKKANAAALDVTIRQQLDADLDWSTFELSSIQFGSTTIDLPAGLQTYAIRVDATNVDGTPVVVDIAARLDAQTGLVTWTFRSLDPLTGLMPENPVAGFLPVNDSTGRGQGSVNYTIRPRAGSTTGTALDALASIVFDTNAPLDTPSVVNTIDAGPPTSSVAALPPTVTTPSFLVSWSGTDDAGGTPVGSGIAAYDVYVSDNGGSFTLWKPAIADTSATYTGQAGHTYGFYSLAIDGVGYRQSTPAPPATTQVAAHVWHNYAEPCDVDSLDGVQPQDVLIIINWINAHPGDSTPPAPPAVAPPYYDVDADDQILPQDVLLVVNHINAHLIGSGEGEARLGRVLTPIVSPAADWPIRPSGGAATAGREASAAASAEQASRAVLWESQAARPPVREAAAGSRSSTAQRRGRTDELWDDWDAGLDPLDAILLDLAPGVRPAR